ncbi:cytochrome c oxidase subunit 3 [Brucella melitensis]|uniref:cytochrome c oxidase subunit 3 n=1 Tax=Brucella melitensis TaxID=29459 RepID=UPI0024955EE6|nr:cytochrome c oxidase subunit 3 [Brucella melitensis]
MICSSPRRSCSSWHGSGLLRCEPLPERGASGRTPPEFTGGVWPPKGIGVLDPLHLPLYNTVILLLSGTTLTWAHHALLHNDRKGHDYGSGHPRWHLGVLFLLRAGL